VRIDTHPGSSAYRFAGKSFLELASGVALGGQINTFAGYIIRIIRTYVENNCPSSS